LHAAYELGIASFDTAPDFGSAEQRIGAFLRDQNLYEEVAICTRLPTLAAVDTGRIEQQVEDHLTASLRRLGSDIIDTYLVRSGADVRTHGQALVDVLAHQRLKGRVLSVGICVSGPAELSLFEEYPELGVVEHPFSLLDRRLLVEGWSERLATGGTRLRLKNAALNGLLAAPMTGASGSRAADRPVLEKLTEILARFDMTPDDAALPFALAIDPDSVVVNADTIDELESLAASAHTVLPQQVLSELQRELPAEHLLHG
jgi:aryl-alcohol dehydrogenase-like predicted oxidoreductase